MSFKVAYSKKARYYEGTVVSYASIEDEAPHTVRYDDGDVFAHNLDEEPDTWEWIAKSAQPPSAEDESSAAPKKPEAPICTSSGLSSPSGSSASRRLSAMYMKRRSCERLISSVRAARASASAAADQRPLRLHLSAVLLSSTAGTSPQRIGRADEKADLYYVCVTICTVQT